MLIYANCTSFFFLNRHLSHFYMQLKSFNNFGDKSLHIKTSPCTSFSFGSLCINDQLSRFTQARLSVPNFGDTDMNFCTRPFLPEQIICRNRRYRITKFYEALKLKLVLISTFNVIS